MGYKKLTPEERNERVQSALDKIEDGVSKVFTSENYLNYLKCMSKFHNYSYGNTLLILAQKKDASIVAGFNAWKSFNRTVKKGEKGISILAPANYKRIVEREVKDADGKAVLDDKGKPKKEKIEVPSMYFRTVYVFDVSQTEGEPLPQLCPELEGTNLKARELISAVREVTDYSFSFATPETDTVLRGGAKGYCSPTSKTIVIREDMSDMQKAKTALHEYAHAILHEDSNKPREQKEVEAESVAFVLANHFGLDTSDYSFPYIATWSSKYGKEELKDVLKGIQQKSNEIINKIEPAFEKRLEKYAVQEKTNKEQENKVKFSPTKSDDFER